MSDVAGDGRVVGGDAVVAAAVATGAAVVVAVGAVDPWVDVSGAVVDDDARFDESHAATTKGIRTNQDRQRRMIAMSLFCS